MRVEKLLLTIESVTARCIGCHADNHLEEVRFYYYPEQKKLKFREEKHLSEILNQYQFQFEKIIRSAISGKLTVGQKIRCVFLDGFNFLTETDFNNFIRMDRRGGGLRISSSTEESEGLIKIFTDGSFTPDSMKSGYGGIIKYSDGGHDIFSRTFSSGGSNLMELLAVLEGLNRLRSINEIQVNTDSRFVIRGMVQWMHFWKHNDWQTAYGRQVRFEEHWRQLFGLSEDKLIEFKWIKGHSGHLEQEFCHNLARKSAEIL